jgi:hypothetical protein
MKPPDELLAWVRDPSGREVVLLARIWHDKILLKHRAMAIHLDDVLETVRTPDHRWPDRRPTRWRYYRRGAGPSGWLLVVVSFEQSPARIITAYGVGKDPEGWAP